MAPHSITRTLCVLPLLFPLALSHMQMEVPSPLRDPHSNRANEPKDYNILTPLHADGSDFTCKGFQWNTPLVSVATYQAGEEYEMRLKGGATHGGGSCQISMSCDNGRGFKVLKSIVGGCPLQKSYRFKIPKFARSGKCLLAWSWFNKVGNREMYMNCAVVDIVGAGDNEKRDTSSAAGATIAQAALSTLPDMFVANLKSINDCTVKETVDANFPDPGDDVEYADGMTASSAVVKRSDGGACTGVGRGFASGAVASSPSSSDPVDSPSRGSNGGNDGQWHGDDTGASSNLDDTNGGSATSSCNDGQYHPECFSQPLATPATSASEAAATPSNGDSEYEYEYYDPSADATPDDDSATTEDEPALKKQGEKVNYFHQHHGNAGVFYENETEGADAPDYDYGADLSPYGVEVDTSFNRQIPARKLLDQEEPSAEPTFQSRPEPTILVEDESEPTALEFIPGDAASPTNSATAFDISPWIDELAKMNKGPPYDVGLPEPEGFAPSEDLPFDVIGDTPDDAFSPDHDFSMERLEEQRKQKIKGKATSKSKSTSKTRTKGTTKSVGKGKSKSTSKHNAKNQHSRSSHSHMSMRPTETPPFASASSSTAVPAAIFTLSPAKANAIPTSTSSSDPTACPAISYATSDPNAFLPCKPGSFLCKSPTEYYTCGQYGGSEWTYGALRQVAAGMTCVPRTDTNESKSKRSLWSWLVGEQVMRDDESPRGGSEHLEHRSLFDDLVKKLDTLGERLNTLLRSYSKNDKTMSQGIGLSSTWGTTMELLKRHLAGIPSSGVADPNDPLNVILNKIESLSSAIDRLAKYYNTSSTVSARRSLLWHKAHDKYTSGELYMDPLAAALSGLDDVIIKLELLVDNKNGGQTIRKLAIGAPDNAFAPVFLRLSRLEELVSQLSRPSRVEKRQIGFFDDEGDDVKAEPFEVDFTDLSPSPDEDESFPVDTIEDPGLFPLNVSGIHPSKQSAEDVDKPSGADAKAPYTPPQFETDVNADTAPPTFANLPVLPFPPEAIFPNFGLTDEDTTALDTLNEFDDFETPSSESPGPATSNDLMEDVSEKPADGVGFDAGLPELFPNLSLENDMATAHDTLEDLMQPSGPGKPTIPHKRQDDDEYGYYDTSTNQAQSTTEGEGETETETEDSSPDAYVEGPACHPKKAVTTVPEAEIDNDVDIWEDDEGLCEYGRRKLFKRQRDRYWEDDTAEPDPEEDVAAAAELIFGKSVNPAYRDAHRGGPTGPTFQGNDDEGNDADADANEEEKKDGGSEEPTSNQNDEPTPDQEEPEEESIPTSSSEAAEPTETEATATSATQTSDSTPLSSAAVQLDFEGSVLVPASDDAPENGASDDAELSGNWRFMRRQTKTATKTDKKNDKKKSNKKKEKLTNDGVADKTALEALFGPEPKDYQAKMDKAKSEEKNPPTKEPERLRGQVPSKGVGKASGLGAITHPAPATDNLPVAVPLPNANAQPANLPRPVGEMSIPGHSSSPLRPHINGVDEKTPTTPKLEDLPSADASDVKALFPDLEPPVSDGLLPEDLEDLKNVVLPATSLGAGGEDEDLGVPLEVNATDLESGADPVPSGGLAPVDEDEDFGVPVEVNATDLESGAVPLLAGSSVSPDESEEPPNEDSETPSPSTPAEDAENETLPILPSDAPPVEPLLPPSSIENIDEPAVSDSDPEPQPPAPLVLNTTTSIPLFMSNSSTITPITFDTDGDEAPDDADWEDGAIFPTNTADDLPSTTYPPEAPTASDIPAILPYIMGPGPVIPPGVSVDWPGPLGSNNIPASEVTDEPLLGTGTPDVGETTEDGEAVDRDANVGAAVDSGVGRRAVNKVEVVRRVVERRNGVVEALVWRGCGVRNDGIVRAG